MPDVLVFEAHNTLDALLDRVECGDDVVITRQGRKVARLVREGSVVDTETARRAAAEILEASAGVTLGGISLRELIDEGRR